MCYVLKYGKNYVSFSQINVSFEEFKEEDTFFVREWLRQKGLEKLCEIFES